MIHVKIDSFEGPLDLLLHLIEKAEVDIYDISITEITDQYVEYISSMQQLELDIASEFMVMAASLLALKSRMLLPKQELILEPFDDWDEDELDPREELIQKLIEYKKYKQLAFQLRDKEAERSKLYTRPAENLAVFIEKEEINPVSQVTLLDLVLAFEKALKVDEPKYTSVQREEISIEMRIDELLLLLEEVNQLSFSQLFVDLRSKTQIVTTFLAVLELMKRNQIYCQQDRLFADILIFKQLEASKDGEGSDQISH